MVSFEGITQGLMNNFNNLGFMNVDRLKKALDCIFGVVLVKN